MIFKVLCICFVITQVLSTALCATEVTYMHCKDGNNLLTLVINPCVKPSDDNAVCVFQHGNKIKVSAAFVAPFSSRNLETESSVIFKGHTLPFPDSGSNPCQGKIAPKCPVEKGKVHLLTYRMDVLKYYPTGPMDVKFSIRDKKSKVPLACAKVSIVVTRNPKLSYD